MVTSAYERDIRARLEQADAFPLSDNTVVPIAIGVLRGIIADIDMWKRIVVDDIDKWSFDALVVMARRLLDEVYPEAIFPSGTSVTWDKDGRRIVTPLGETGPQLVAGLRRLIELIEKE